MSTSIFANRCHVNERSGYADPVAVAKRIRTARYKEFGERLRQWRGDVPVETAVRLVQQMNVKFDGATLRGWEYGWIERPDPVRLLALARVYDVSIDEMLRALMESRMNDVGKPIRIPKSDTSLASTNVEGFKAVPLLATEIAAGQPLIVEPDEEKDSSLAFREDVVGKFVKPICLRVGRREESMMPTILPRDVVVIDQRPERRKAPTAGHIFAVNYAPLVGEPGGGAIKRVEISEGMLILSSDNSDKTKYGTKAFDLQGKNLLDILKGEVVWYGRYVGSGKGR